MSKERMDMNKVIQQAKESLKFLETLEKGTLARAKKFVRMSTTENRIRLTNEKVLKGLQKIGVASRSEVETLREEVQKLQTELTQLRRENASRRSDSQPTV